MSESERRRYPRIGRKYGVKYRVVGETGNHIGMVTNLSQGGVVLESRHALEVGSVIEVEFPESIFGGPRSLTGRIVWRRCGADGGDLIGCQFVRVDGSARKAKAPASNGMKPEPVVSAGRERRRYDRWEQKVLLKVRCITPGPFEEQSTRPAQMTDISKGGVEIVSTREYAKNLVLEMQFPESALGPAQTFHARILRSSGSDKAGQFALGCAFVRLVSGSRS